MVLSDFYDRETETMRELRHVTQRGHDVAMLQFSAPEERNLSVREQVELVDSESGERRLIAPSAAAEYAREYGEFISRCRQFAVQEGIDYGFFDCGLPPERTLRDYLLHRRSEQAVGATLSAADGSNS